jgi:hypothetical protein
MLAGIKKCAAAAEYKLVMHHANRCLHVQRTGLVRAMQTVLPT